ncbi:flagellar assembly peptidoglycan hydrolase FlgJ [Chitinimonas sp. BJB300]|uniref:flagellar assembly peptidoglycan hydrolase FlgJ n=1 Tax=Chitinimonas sp. BJB300 TaxID=1559339 RepID=UPI000C0EC4DB|nr:flagellar assembly peptidoglycan hydrolase FlgJ [Chitinimonas sp. BJB300]PHV11241.1 flagellar assembly peptidoglycan hydrolase FlgJ [Chitinimonas sp. BJB300]TSJ88613.1 flagellar assembly peptidoglycan hydrolase FlgJ [Chitinimonas sp. BJB300]
MQVANSSANASLNAKLAIDAQAVGDLRSKLARDPKGAARDVASQFEKMFLDMVMKSMRQATPKFDELNSDTVGMFQGMYDQQLSQNLTSGTGLGLADMITAQLEKMTSNTLQTPLKRPASSTFGSPGIKAITSPTQAETGTSSADDFIATVGTAAVGAAQAMGLSPHLMLAHAALETGWGKKPITDSAGNNTHNLFGIKAGKDWKGKTADIVTTEYVDGKAQKRVETFRAYDSYTAAFNDYGQLLSKRYGDAAQAGGNAKVFATELQEGGYATDPSYAKKLARVAEHPALKAYRATA